MSGVDAARLQTLLADACTEFGVPGASLGVLRDGALTEVATGVLNVETGVEVTTDSVFQTGSITKSYTSTLIMQLADEGRLAVDQPIVELLPELDLGDPQAKEVTVRHLLSHTSGIEGDHFADTGRGDDVLARYVESCAGLGFAHPVGATMSYCNTGLVLAGRVIEKLTDTTWDKALRDRLFGPLGLTHSVTLPEDAIRFRVAFGHHEEEGTTKLVPAWMLPRSLGPAGIITASVGDLLRFARLHMDGGIAPDGTRLLAADSVREMQAPFIELPDRWTLGTHWGLGWFMTFHDGRKVYGHDGNTIGQSAYLRIVPDAGTAIALMVNGGHMQDTYQAVFRALLADLCGIALPEPLTPPDEPPPVDIGQRVGVYERVGVRIDIDERAGRLVARLTPTGHLAELDDDDEVIERTLVPVTDSLFISKEEDDRTWIPLVFYTLADGSPYVHTGARATPKRVTS